MTVEIETRLSSSSLKQFADELFRYACTDERDFIHEKKIVQSFHEHYGLGKGDRNIPMLALTVGDVVFYTDYKPSKEFDDYLRASKKNLNEALRRGLSTILKPHVKGPVEGFVRGFELGYDLGYREIGDKWVFTMQERPNLGRTYYFFLGPQFDVVSLNYVSLHF